MPIRGHRSLLLIALTFVGVAWLACPAMGAIDFQPISPDELKMTGYAKAPGAPAIILFRQVDRDDNELSTHEDDYVRIKVLNEEGRKYANVEIPYWKGNLKISKLHARTIRPDGSIVVFEGKPFEKTIVKARGVKILAKTFTLPEATVGSILEYTYRLEFTSDYLFDSHWIVSEELFTKSARFTLKPAQSFLLKVHWSELPPDVKPAQDAKSKEIHLETTDIPAFRVEDFMPPENEVKARVDFTYTRSRETDPDKFWKQFGKDCESYLDDYIDKKKVMEQAVEQIVSAGDSAEVKLQKIYARVQQIRNISYEEEKTSQEEKRNKDKWPKNVEELWKMQHGDSAQLNRLFVALTRAAGMEASEVWVPDRSSYFFDAKSMDGNRLDNNVVLVKLNGKDVYLDPGSLYAPFGMLPWSESGVKGYKVDKEGGSWVTTTLPDSSKSRLLRKAELKLSESGDLEGKVTVTFTGFEASQRRSEEQFADDAARRKYLEDDVKEWLAIASQVELTSQPDWKSSSTSMTAEFSLKVTGWATATGRRTFLPVGLFCATEKHLFEHADRVHPIYFEFPFQLEDDITIELPAAWKIVSVPTPKKEDARVIVYTASAADEKGTLKLHRLLTLDLTMVDATGYPTLRAFFQQVRTHDDQQVLLQSANTSASN